MVSCDKMTCIYIVVHTVNEEHSVSSVYVYHTLTLWSFCAIMVVLRWPIFTANQRFTGISRIQNATPARKANPTYNEICTVHVHVLPADGCFQAQNSAVQGSLGFWPHHDIYKCTHLCTMLSYTSSNSESQYIYKHFWLGLSWMHSDKFTSSSELTVSS